MRSSFRRGLWLFALSCAYIASAYAYWAPNHMQINGSVATAGEPVAFKRAGQDVKKLDDYVQHIFFINDRVAHKVRAVEFHSAIGGVIGQGGDAPANGPSGQARLARALERLPWGGAGRRRRRNLT